MIETYSTNVDSTPSSAPHTPLADRVSWRAVFWILLACSTYHLLLCFVNTWVFRTSPATVGLAEILIYAACIPIIARRISLQALLVFSLIAINFCVIALIRGEFDFKSVRDLAIPVFFVWVGRNVASEHCADDALKRVVVVVLAAGFFELLFVNLFSSLFDVFSYYVSIGGINEKGAMYVGQKLALNGFRPEGIGRTILPDLLGNHRVSSVFLEPVSLGNFAVIITAWGLSKDRSEAPLALFYLASAVILVALSDSRFGMLIIAGMMAIRCVHLAGASVIASVLPFLSVAGILVLGTYLRTSGDNFLGRLFLSGSSLLNFNEQRLLGVGSVFIFYGDAGYPYIFSRFGLLLCIFLWFFFFLIPRSDAKGQRFRVFVASYMSLILSVSGSSFFALKTAGLLWFLFGVLSVQKIGLSSLQANRKTGRGAAKLQVSAAS